MGSYDDKNVVLLDSDSDSELQRTSKKQKMSPLAQGADLPKPFMHDSESDSSIEQINGSSNPKPASIMTQQSSSPSSSPLDVEQESSDLLSNASAASSDLEEILPTDMAGSSVEPGELPGSEIPKRRTVFESRRFLKTRGPMEFLQEYLPPTASSEDILDLIVKLGFSPRNLPPVLEGENLLQLIKLLHLAMKRVRQLRSRLDDFYSIDHVLQKIESASNILIITGAGISTSLGIPDFRSSRGFYSRLSNLGLSDPQEVFDLEIFRSDPSIFYSIAHMILPPDNACAPLHKFIRLLQDKGKLLRNYTQNIDNLEAIAGIDQDKLIQCHGSFSSATCVTCGSKELGLKLYPSIRNKEIPFCSSCTKRRLELQNGDAYVEESFGVMKPDITFFGEALPQNFHDHINQDIKSCDLVISIGTSLKVAPVAEIVDKVPAYVPQILINKDPIHHCNFDVSMLGYCDDVVSYLCDKLGKEWNIDHEDYPSLVGETHENLKLKEDEENGVYHVVNERREHELPKVTTEPIPEPDIIVLEPSLT